MKTEFLVPLLVILLAVPLLADARGSSSHFSKGSSSLGSSHSRASTSGHTYSGRRVASGTAARDRRGRIARSSAAKGQFKKTSPCPSTGRSSGSCPGYVVDHKVPLKRGGADKPSNMQWQTKEAAKQKDKWE